MSAPGDPIEILLIEDNPGDVELTQHALRTGKIANHLTVTEYGAEALALLHAANSEATRRPQLILLDLNLPDMNGLASSRKSKPTRPCAGSPWSSCPPPTPRRT